MIAPHDDEIKSDYLGLLVDALENSPSASVAFSDMMRHALNGEYRLRIYDRCDGLISPVERALQVVRGRGPWSICYRGVIRMAVYREIGGLRTHLGGEYKADKPWILRLAMAGELIRIPRVLCIKHEKPTSTGKTWTDKKRYKIAVLLSCFRAVAESRLSTVQALPVYRALCREIIRVIERAILKR